MIAMNIDGVFRRGGFFAAALALLFLAGCGGGGSSSSGDQQPGGAALTGTNSEPTSASLLGGEQFKTGDNLIIAFSDIPGTGSSFEEKISENGKITLLYSETFEAVGKTRRDLETEIKARYVPKYFKYLTVTIKPLDQFYFVGGDVKTPNRFPYVGKMTVLKAIQSAGDFTDFAKKSAVVLTRGNGQVLKINCIKAQRDPRLDLEVFPGDRIHVPRRGIADIF
jgi:polysaccharide export outer membrane protein